MEGWRLGLKALAIYRDGSKGVQVLSTKKEPERAEKPVSRPRRERLPDTRKSVTHKFSVAGHEGYITVGLYPDGRPGELFITMAKEGSTIGGLMDCFGTAVSMSLQYGVPLEVYVNKFSHTRFEPWGHTKHPDIRIAKSIVDYIFRWMGVTFLPGYREAANGVPAGGESEEGPPDAETETRPAATKDGGLDAPQGSASGSRETSSTGSKGDTNGRSAQGTSPVAGNGSARAAAAAATLAPQPAAATNQVSDQFAAFQADAPSCDNCGAITVRTGNCYLCHVCGNSMGCS